MKQILQNLKNGEIELMDVPVPQVRGGHVLIATSASLISVGTEKMLLDFGRANILEKARQQPDKVKQVMEKMKTDGIAATFDAVKAKMDMPIPLGNSNAGVVIGVSEGVEGFAVGDRVVSNGYHSEIVCVPKNLCAKIPDNVSDEEASFNVLGAIALHGVRLAKPTLGETFCVFGLGLIGLLTVQILRASGCNVIGLDMNRQRLDIAAKFGAKVIDLTETDNPVEAVLALTGGQEVDGSIIAVATQSNDPMHQAAGVCRKKGRIILVGVTGLELSRADFYEKELSFQVSCSYGPGRYDPNYEEKGHDYPLGYVRWTEQRNFEAFLGLLAEGKLDLKSLVSHRYAFEDAPKAYDTISGNKEPYLGIVLEYPEGEKVNKDVKVSLDYASIKDIKRRDVGGAGAEKEGKVLPVVGLIGAGGFTGQVLLPALKKTGADLRLIVSSGGTNASILGRNFGFRESGSDAREVFNDPEVNTVFITTRHNTHARFVKEALESGKHVFVEKPLCISEGELEDIIKLYNNSSSKSLLMVGFNRRFSPLIKKMKNLLDMVNDSKDFIMTVNAGNIPEDHWVQDPYVGGGRIIGEACHFIDLLRYLAGSNIKDVTAKASHRRTDGKIITDRVSFVLSFKDGSTGTVHYLSNGHRSFPKERLEVFAAGRMLILDNFRALKGYGWPRFRDIRLLRQDKGHSDEVAAFMAAVCNGKASPIPFEEIVETTRVSLSVEKNVR